MTDFVIHLKSEVLKKIRKIESGGENVLDKALAVIHLLNAAFTGLKEYILAYSFKSPDEEIYFFKEVKPNLFKYLVFYKKMYNIEMNKPLTSYDEQKVYYENELEVIQRYISKRLDLYRYYRQGATYMDQIYFTRGHSDIMQYMDTDFHERDPQFSTLADFKVTRILANDLLRDYLLSEIETLDIQRRYIDRASKIKITWMAPKTGLIELIYALDTVKAFGDIPLSKLSDYIQDVFNIDLGNTSRSFSEMKIRNSQIPFLEKLTSEMERRMNKKKERG